MNEKPKLNLFISYCHADEDKKEMFEKFLVTLRKNGEITDWNDRKIDVGSKFDSEIKRNLEESDLICLLISQDFLNSDYCMNEELFRALKQVDDGKSRIIPIILDHCMWLDTEISNYMATPKDGKPICDFIPETKAWMEVMSQIKTVIKKLELKPLKKKEVLITPEDSEVITADKLLLLKDSFIEEINSTEITLQSPHKENVTLQDIFIYPDFKFLDDDISEHEVTRNSEFYSELSRFPTHSLVVGEEQCGKTSFAKMVFKTAISDGAIPVLLKGRDINKSDINHYLERALNLQYDNLNIDQFKHNNKEKVLIIDDLSDIKLNHAYLDKFVSRIMDTFDKVLFLSDESIRFDEHKANIFNNFEQFELLQLGYERRDELIKRWHSLGREEEIEDEYLINLVKTTATHLDMIVRKNIVPRKPIFILMILQVLDSGKPSDYSLTSHGYCYQRLIEENLNKVKIKPEEIEKYINYLSQLAFYMYEKETYSLNESQMQHFHKFYKSKFNLGTNDQVIEKLLDSKILKLSNENYSIRYKYIYYFYAAKYMSNHSECLNFVEQLCRKTHIEKDSNILIFITHHTKNDDVISLITEKTTQIYKDTNEALLDRSDTEFLRKFMSNIPKLVMKQKHNVDEARKESLRKQDQSENKSERFDIESLDDDPEFDCIRDITRSVRAIEILGQIIKNRHASIELGQLETLSAEATKVGLRFLSFYLKSTEQVQTEVMDMIHSHLEDNLNLTVEEISKEVSKTFMQLVYQITFNVVRKVSFSVGHKELVDLFSDIALKADTPAFYLIEASMLLEFSSSRNNIPKRKLENIWKKVNSNFLAKRLMQDVILQYQYFNYVSYQDKAWIASKLEIPLETQEIVQSNKKPKALSRKH
ncbi:hypothetical protein PULV_a1054 [Pseudoalteromonas ulvae UL12]|uniref:toll/interleukin-1 receptor domain-containing protein n=1 Tax=Pseudoalteromonas ulvae TaxID=107327 RepID=UPI00186BAC58|nr:toll/interleukin-1 receptor domain-containing protein [Pseudoalteromonas ulvae]MBE0363591.1 hypothetical protein [Pseudoalteromonas ulvae UL12]